MMNQHQVSSERQEGNSVKPQKGFLHLFSILFAFWLQADRTSNVWTNLWQYESGSEKESSEKTARYPH
jgi:hypothetical protein